MRIVISVSTILLLIAALLASAWGSLDVAMDVCDGDEGLPFSAPASAAGHFCNSGHACAYEWGQFVIPPAIVLVTGVVSIVLRSLSPVLFGAIAAAVVGVVMVAVIQGLPSTCTETQLHTLKAFQCDTY